MVLITAISFGVAALVLLVCFVASMRRMLSSENETNDFALAWLLFWLFDDE